MNNTLFLLNGYLLSMQLQDIKGTEICLYIRTITRVTLAQSVLE